MTDVREAYFARVAPLIGRGLGDHTVRALALPLTARVLELLVALRLQRVVHPAVDERSAWPLDRLVLPQTATGTARAVFEKYIQWKNHLHPVSWQNDGQADLTLSARFTATGEAPHVLWCRRDNTVTLVLAPGDLWSYLNLCDHVARRVRDILLERGPWPDGRIYLGDAQWPFCERPNRPVDPETASPELARYAHLGVVGLGSIGSEVIRWLAGRVGRWTLIDGGKVSVFNPHRQWFSLADVGKPKVTVLGARLVPEPATAIAQAVDAQHMDEFEAWLERDRPDLVLLATGTHDHAALAQALWRRGIAHVAACAYPRARYFEITTVLPSEGTPCLQCFRGHLYRGAQSAPAVGDEVMQFVYQQPDATMRDRAWIDLVAEPATPIDTGRVAHIAARCCVEALAMPHARSAWFRKMLATGTTCLLGGNTVEQAPDGTLAYGIAYAGQVVRLGLEDIVGVGDIETCQACGRRLAVVHRCEVPQASDDAIDLALASS